MDLKIYTDNIEPQALDQIYTLTKQPAFKDCKIRIMPDVHAGAGCVIGFTADLGDKVIPNIVGIDIGCGMRCVKLEEKDLDLPKLDEIVHKVIPSGRNIHAGRQVPFDRLNELYCYRSLRDTKRIERSIGTLGGGNHFIEIDQDENGCFYLVIHSGSRNLGKQVAEYYQRLAIEIMQGKDKLYNLQDELIKEYKDAGRRKEIQRAIKELHRKFQPDVIKIPKELCYLTEEYREKYLHDMQICQEYAALNRKIMAEIILREGSLHKKEEFETVHNYIDLDSNMVRKGAISAKKEELLLIPINMKDGCILGVGKGNDDWNQSAPHGAGRIMSRSAAKECVDINEYRNVMQGVYTTSVGMGTIDEAPMVYKTLEDIVSKIGNTVEVLRILKPVYNFKACD